MTATEVAEFDCERIPTEELAESCCERPIMDGCFLCNCDD